MGTLNAFYVRSNGGSANASIREKFPKAEIESGQDFVGVTLADDVALPPIDQLLEMSSALETDVMWLSFQSVVDAFEFHHWRAGQSLRTLVYGCYKEERTWERIEGTPEPWEREAFFPPRALTRPWFGTDDEKRERERIWREAELLPGRAEPSLNSRECARKVAEYYGLPGWSYM
jgi:hypothetical protein